jgi:CRISPR-associated protein Csm1
MKIGHIFNTVSPKTDKELIDSQAFEIGYWRREQEDYYLVDEECRDDFSKRYYHALVASDSDLLVSKYDNEKINNLVETLGDDLLLISGDFWGIQKFIFDRLTSSKASKILRSRSAMVQLITYAVVDRIKQEFKGSEALLFGAGKFMILAKDENYHKIKNIQKELDKYFLENFFGQNGFIISSTKTTGEKLLNQKNMKSDLDALGVDNDNRKLNKFDLLNVEDDDILIDPFKNSTIDDSNSCKFCNKRIADSELEEDSCDICFNQINLGKKLTTYDYINIIQFGRLSSHKKIDKNMIEIIKLGNKSYYARFSNYRERFSWGKSFDISDKRYDNKSDKWSLNSYVPKGSYDSIKTFSEYIEENGKTTSSGLMALKADIDKLGDTFRELYREDFRLFNRLSREVEFFFSDYITSLVARRDNVYTVFAGGDDLFLIGEYREIVDLVKEIREEFYSFALNKTTISMGLVMFKPTTPITFVSKMADEAEERAKIERDSIDIFGVSMKFDEFYEIENSFGRVVRYLKDNGVETTTFYYRLIELCDMRERLNSNDKFNPQDALWKSKLNYLFIRNIRKENNDIKIFNLLNSLIERGERFKPSLFLKIYQNRDEKKEQRDDQI